MTSQLANAVEMHFLMEGWVSLYAGEVCAGLRAVHECALTAQTLHVWGSLELH